MDQISVQRQVGKGALLLLWRQIFVHTINIGGSITIARILLPSDFGIFAIFNFFTSFISIFSELGLGASLIQQKEKPTTDQFHAVFTIQLIISIILVVIIWFCAPLIVSFYHLKIEQVWQIRAIIFILPISFFQSIHNIQLERDLQFSKISFVEISQSIAYQLIMVFCALAGFKIWTFIVGGLLRSVIGACFITVISKYRPKLYFNFSIVLKKIEFGFLYQSSTILSFVKDSIVPIFIGFFIGSSAVGYIGWASMLAAYPILGISALNRLYLPSFSLMRNDKEKLIILLEKIFFWIHAVVAPLTIIIVVFVRPITMIIYKSYWMPAIPLVLLFCIGNILIASSGPCMGLLNALGKPNRTLYYTTLWAVLSWLLGVPLLKLYGLKGFGIAQVIINFSNLALIFECQKIIPFRLWSNVFSLWLSALLIGLIFYFLLNLYPAISLLSLVLHIFLFIGAFLLLVFISMGKVIKTDLLSIWRKT